jgi:hypothetical protein
MVLSAGCCWAGRGGRAGGGGRGPTGGGNGDGEVIDTELRIEESGRPARSVDREGRCVDTDDLGEARSGERAGIIGMGGSASEVSLYGTPTKPWSSVRDTNAACLALNRMLACLFTDLLGEGP